MSDSALPAAPVFPGLTKSICTGLRELANPGGTGRLSPQLLRDATEALTAARSQAQAAARQAARGEALDYLALEQAFGCALATLELVHAEH